MYSAAQRTPLLTTTMQQMPATLMYSCCPCQPSLGSSRCAIRRETFKPFLPGPWRWPDACNWGSRSFLQRHINRHRLARCGSLDLEQVTMECTSLTCRRGPGLVATAPALATSDQLSCSSITPASKPNKHSCLDSSFR